MARGNESPISCLLLAWLTGILAAMLGESGTFLGSSPGFSVRESTDLDHYRAQPGNWEVKVTQLTRGRFRSRIRSIELPGLIAYHNQWGCAAQIHGQSPDGCLMIGGILYPDVAHVTWCGHRKDRRHFAATSYNREIEFSPEGNAQNVVFLFEPELLLSVVGEEAVETLCNSKHLDFADSGERLLDIGMDLLAQCEARPEILERPAIASRAVSVIMRGVEDCFEELDLNKPAGQLSSRGELVHKAILYVREAVEATSALAMAQAVGVSQKTLELAFREVMNITPGKYLMLTRLNGAHHALSRGDKMTLTVTDVAMRQGFTHMGRFSKAYKDLFGEHPSDTLSRPL